MEECRLVIQKVISTIQYAVNKHSMQSELKIERSEMSWPIVGINISDKQRETWLLQTTTISLREPVSTGAKPILSNKFRYNG
jgi:hypothetical protein